MIVFPERAIRATKILPMKHPRAFLIVVLLLLQCRERVPGTAQIDPRLRPMADSFLREASSRGVELSIDAEDLIFQFGSLEGKRGGSCKPNTTPKTIIIDSLKWKFIDEVEKEALVFHEMAHCLLMRSHNDAVFEFGECRSLLREHVSSCHLNWSNAQWRNYYLDELFAGEETEAPRWYISRPDFSDTAKLSPSRKIILEGPRFQYFDMTDTEVTESWIISITACRAATGFSHMGLRINEIALETSFIASVDTSGCTPFRARLIIGDARTDLVEAISGSASRTMHLSLQKRGNAVYIFFDKTLRYILPINPAELKIGGYSSLPEDHYDIRRYTVR